LVEVVTYIQSKSIFFAIATTEANTLLIGELVHQILTTGGEHFNLVSISEGKNIILTTAVEVLRQVPLFTLETSKLIAASIFKDNYGVQATFHALHKCVHRNAIVTQPIEELPVVILVYLRKRVHNICDLQ